jgi:tripartite motif-containing protein 71
MDSILQNSSDDSDKRNDISTNLFLTNLLNTLPKIDTLQNRPTQIDNSKNGNSIFSNMLPFDIEGTNNKPFSYKVESPLDLYGAPGSHVIPKQKSTSRSNSPHSSSSSSQSIYCGRCENNACHRCLDCNDVFCSDCVNEHMINSYTEKHNIISIGKITPIGIGIGAPAQSLFFGDLHNLHHSINEPQCENHNEQLRFLCNTCKKVICQECSLTGEHKDHDYMSVSNITVDKAKEKLKSICESSKLGIKFIKTSIDRAVAASQSVERDALEISSRVRKALRLLILGMCAK